MDSSSIVTPRETTPEGEECLPSCDSCRRRKLKCTRQRPSCGHCQRLAVPCIYEQRRNKPGLKGGAVEALNRRLEIVERALFVRQQNGQPSTSSSALTPAAIVVAPSSNLEDHRPVIDALASLSQEINKLNSNISTSRPTALSDSRKRKRPCDGIPEDCCPASRRAYDITCEHLREYAACSIVEERLDELLDVYFTHVHPWIPMIHEAAFRRRTQTLEGRRSLDVVLRAMIVAALRFMKREGEPYPSAYVDTESKKSRDRVILTAMDTLSVENLQALTIIAFIDIGNGQPNKAWSTIGSLTRTVEYLQLSVESEACQRRLAILQPLPSLPVSSNWVTDEERRRVFWNVFILDRFCSVSTGLTAADVCRRLPVCGGHWFNIEPAETPYFGIWDPSSAKMGNSITFLPAHYPSHSKLSSRATADPEASSSSEGSRRLRSPPPVDMSKVGAFAYYIESMESLSRVTSHFLHQRVDFEDRAQVSNWLMRFKELDLRLIHWKLYLPRQWKDSGLSRKAMPGVMDPNMTVANASHNVSMILLHQRIAYPDTELSGIKLPHLYSAETCQSAATENATITKQFLMGWPLQRPVTPQLGFCAFISARVLLVHSRYYHTQLSPGFESLVESLEEMSRRWIATLLEVPAAHSDTLFHQFAFRLRDLREKSENDPMCRIMVAGSPQDNLPGSELLHPCGPTVHPTNDAGASMSSSLPVTSEQASAVPGEEVFGSAQEADNLLAMSQVLMDQRFMDMDRVISLDDMIFADVTDGAQWDYLGNDCTGMLMNEGLEKAPG